MAAWEDAGKAALVVEDAASRWNRDTQQRRGDWQLKSSGLSNRLTADNLVYAGNGTRTSRQYLQRGGDVYLNDSGVLVVAAQERNSREYVNPVTHVSAINGDKSRLWPDGDAD